MNSPRSSQGGAPDAAEDAGLGSLAVSDAAAWGRAAETAPADDLSVPSQPMATTFTSNVLPLFRSGDIACMTPMGVKLGDADWMCDPGPAHGFPDHGNARIVFAALSRRSMPPDHPWPPSQLDAYDQWMRDGFAW